METVDVEEADDVEEMEEDELFRCRLFRGMNIRLRSSGFIGLRLCPPWAPLTPHAVRLCCVKVGGLATAVMRNDVSIVRDTWEMGVYAVGEALMTEAGREGRGPRSSSCHPPSTRQRGILMPP